MRMPAEGRGVAKFTLTRRTVSRPVSALDMHTLGLIAVRGSVADAYAFGFLTGRWPGVSASQPPSRASPIDTTKNHVIEER